VITLDKSNNKNNNQHPAQTRQPPIWLTYQQTTPTNTNKNEENLQKALFQSQEWIKMETLHNIVSSEIPENNIEEYSTEQAIVIAQVINDIHGNISQKGIDFVEQFGKTYETQFSQQYIFEKGLKKFGDCGRSAAEKELEQLHKRGCFCLIDVSTQKLKKKRKHKEE